MRKLTLAALAALTAVLVALGLSTTTATAAPAPASITTQVATAAQPVTMADFQAGGSGDFYYGPANTATVCGFYGQATNYDNSSGGQTIHWAFKSLDSGYRTTSVVFGGSGGKTVATNGAVEGYTTFGSAYKGVDYTLTFYVSNGAGPCYATLGNSWQR